MIATTGAECAPGNAFSDTIDVRFTGQPNFGHPCVRLRHEVVLGCVDDGSRALLNDRRVDKFEEQGASGTD